ncbi:MAG TPA: PQQ-binding-like beta-propeller repeat protein [Candidatus Limnocylindria bacterium]|nr:PQQ-binding-like beta-propeller repeat protein [Candidatus Limnocylindria bacterium]
MLAATAATLLLGAQATLALDWPQFRGPHRDGQWAETEILESFPSSGLEIKWRHPVGGGWASPVVAAGRVFVLDVELVQPTAHERLHCFEEKTGKVLWVYSYDEKYSEWTYVPERGAGPTATPIVDGDRIYIVAASGNTHCLDVKTGTVLWEKNIGKEYQVAEMSCRPSPLIDGPLLVLFTGAKPGASVLALDKMTGKEVWKALDDPVSNSSPIIITAGGKRQLIAWSDSALSSLDPTDGHTYWRETMATSNNDSAATPVFQGNRLLVSGLMLEVNSNAPTATIRWPEIRTPSKRILSHASTPLLLGDYIYSARTGGEFVCLEAATGRQLWSTNCLTAAKNGASINITPQGNTYFLFTDEGNLIHAQLSPTGYREISRAHLIDPTWPFGQFKFVYAPPAFANRHVFARSEAEVVCASLEAGGNVPHDGPSDSKEGR